MATPLPYAAAVDIGYGRGRLSHRAARSLRRVDSTFGRPVDINEAWRSPEQANANYRAYQRYLNGGPWAPIALPANQSVHCVGEAVDTDDTADWQIRIWNDHGWYWTVYRNGKLVERWHLEYFENRDNHRNDPAFAGHVEQPAPEPAKKENPDMPVFIEPNKISWPNGYTGTYSEDVFKTCRWVAAGDLSDRNPDHRWAVAVYEGEALKAALKLDEVLKADDPRAVVNLSEVAANDVAARVAGLVGRLGG